MLRRWMPVLILAMICSFTDHAGAALPSQTLAYTPRPMSESAAAVVCVHVKLYKPPGIFGHSALTIFKLNGEPAIPNPGGPLSSDSARWTGYWISKTLDEGQWKNLDFSANPKKAKKKYFPYNGRINYFRNFEKNSTVKDGERICVPVTQNELDSLDKLIAARRDKRYNLWSNCNDFTIAALATVTHGEITFYARSPKALFCTMPDILLNLMRDYNTKNPSPSWATLTYTPTSPYEKDLLEESIEKESRRPAKPSTAGEDLVCPRPNPPVFRK